MEETQVIIVGGGVSGLAAAKVLSNKINFVLIEAQGYLGGRISTIDAGSNLFLDMGAQYVVGNKSKLYKICKDLHMLLNEKDINDETMVITTDGRTFDSEWNDKADDFWERSIDDVDEKFHGRKVKHPVSFADFVPQQFRQRLLSSSLFPRDLIEPIIHCFINSEMIDSACSLSNLNLLEYNGYGDPPGEYENELKNGGYRPFINYLRSFIPDEKQIRLNCEVQRVKYMERERKLLVEMVDLRTEEKKFMLCDQIIWTTSLGFLKENFQRIFASERLLIEQKQNAIDQIGFGILNKVVIIYKEKFWPNNINYVKLLHTQPYRLVDLSPQVRAELHSQQVGQNLIEEIANSLYFYGGLSSTHIPILICWFADSLAIKIENINEQTLGQICHEVLCRYLRLDQNQYKPIKVFRSQWFNNKYIRGSYSYQALNSTKQHRRELKTPYAPDGVPRIFFAGEATHEDSYGIVNAAYETGVEVAKKLL